MSAWRVNEVVWAKIKGFPSWPAVVQDPSDAVEHKPPKKKNMYYVKFVDAADKVLYAWVPQDDVLGFDENLVKFKQATENKGGKTYLDLKKCIQFGETSNAEFKAALLKNPHMATNLGIYSGDEGGAPSTSSRPTPKSEKSTTKSEKPAKKAKTPVSEPESANTSSPSTQKRIRVKPMPEHAVIQTTPKAVRKAPTSAVSKKRPAAAEEGGNSATAKVNGSASKKFKPPIMVTSGRKEAKDVPASKEMTNGMEDSESLKLARSITVSVIGLEDARTTQVARKLLDHGVPVQVWAQDGPSSTELEYHRAERLTDKFKLFDSSDVIFLSAPNFHQLQAILHGDDHLVRKIRPLAKKDVKGICVFTTMTKQESEEISRQFSPKNILYLECAWLGSKEHGVANQLSVVACGSQALFQHCQPIFDLVCGGKITFIAEELGRVQVVKSAVSIAEGVSLAGVTEAAFFAQQNGLDLASLKPFLQPYALGNEITFSKVRQFLDFGHQASDSTATIMKEEYLQMRDAVQVAQTGPGITLLADIAKAAFQTDYVAYRHFPDQERPFVDRSADLNVDKADGKGETVVETIAETDPEEAAETAPNSSDLLSHVGLTSRDVASASSVSKISEGKTENGTTNGKAASPGPEGKPAPPTDATGSEDDEDEVSDAALANSTADSEKLNISADSV